ncbi:flavodoxin family protein [Streptomyces sp. LP11]|uniref:Flavodoxin family protein n=1 Tax=Streptomyces pyxinicus TaxID=2970331 RepID=A0ABT2B9L4_9ACTN|nr:flavodoxin family protein [Streptomyces sp. LP11]MCS0605147.1 flavodoxin family protein [Streptomyces sp. LP11]
MTKALIICTSIAHGNTRRVAEAMAEVLGAKVVAPGEVGPAELAAHDLVGFGSGIFNQRFHPELRRFVAALPVRRSGRGFLFWTCGLPERPFLTRSLVRTLRGKGYEDAGAFGCRGHDTWAPFRLVGGIHRGRPDGRDLAAARAFAEGLDG